MRVIIDRFEGDIAVCVKEDRSVMDIHKDKLPEDAREGDVLLLEGEAVAVDKGSTLERREKLTRLMDTLWE